MPNTNTIIPVDFDLSLEAFDGFATLHQVMCSADYPVSEEETVEVKLAIALNWSAIFVFTDDQNYVLPLHEMMRALISAPFQEQEEFDHDVYLDAEISRLTSEVFDERKAQDKQWGGPEHDDGHPPQAWREMLERHVAKLTTFMGSNNNPNEYVTADDYRDRLIKIAALAIAAAQTYDRTTKTEG